MKPSDITVGVIGYGGAFNMGKHHLELAAQAGMRPLAVAEIDPQRLDAAKKDFPGIETYSSTSAMLKKSDVKLVIIITPHNSHAPLALQCLNAGRHVVVEKPLAITTAQCDAMIAAAKKNHVMLSTYHNRHWDGSIVEALRHVKAGTIGSIVRIEAHIGSYAKPADWWRSSKKISGGILYDWGVHLLEYCLQLINAKITEVVGFATRGVWAPFTPYKNDTNEDEATAIVRFSNGAFVNLRISHLDLNPKPALLEITGTKGTYLMDHSWFEIITPQNGKTVRVRGNNPPSDYSQFYKNIADHLTHHAPLIITPEWARRPIHILDLADQSARKGKALKPKYD
ncbi:MAG: Gfo/Idh/MocA family oxidoreductase [bacterium]|nr:Gfo/Idh/MocA family oxidoreductase [bacterium]